MDSEGNAVPAKFGGSTESHPTGLSGLELEGGAKKPTNCPMRRPLCIAGSNRYKSLSHPVRFRSDPQKVGDYGELLGVDKHNFVRKASAKVTELNPHFRKTFCSGFIESTQPIGY